jgi:hypothetical protein
VTTAAWPARPAAGSPPEVGDAERPSAAVSAVATPDFGVSQQISDQAAATATAAVFLRIKEYGSPDRLFAGMEIIVSNAISLLFFRTAAVLLIVGMFFGIYMSASGNHVAAGAHAHLNLIGFVVMSVYGIFFGLNPARSAGRLPKILWGLNTIAAVVMFPSLVLLLNGYKELEPLVAAASFLALSGAILFAVLLFLPATR